MRFICVTGQNTRTGKTNAVDRLTPYSYKAKLKLVGEEAGDDSRLVEINSMAIGIGVPLKIVIRGQILSQQFNNVCWYLTDGAAFLTADATGIGEAFWNDIKTVWRAAMEGGSELTTTSILVSEPGPGGAFGEFPIPSAEQQGNRAGATSQYLPAFNGVGIRLAVATRTTRPGQKRIVGGLEEDQASGAWTSTYLGLIDDIAAKFSEPITLGAPVATGVLIPIVARVVEPGGTVSVYQEVVGHVINPMVTSQVSRKPGRGV